MRREKGAGFSPWEMSIPNRHAEPDHIIASHRTFFVTASAWERRPAFQSERMARLLIDTLYRYRSEGKYLLHEFVVMPNHFHALISLDETLSIERAMQFIKGGFSYRVKRELNSNYEVWQKGFDDRRIRSAQEYESRRDYVRQNPVRAHLVLEAAAYPYSSANGAFELDPYPAAKAVLLGTS